MRYQRGLSLSGLLLWCVVLVVVGVTGMRVVPSAIDYYKLKKDIKAVAAQVPKEATVADVRKAYDRFAEIDMLPLKSSELDIAKDNGQIVISFAYEKRIPLMTNVSLVIDYKASSLD